MKVLVTGGAGFIGHYLVERLVGEGNEVVVVDDLSPGKLENLAAVRDKIKFVKADICDFAAIKDFFEGVEVVFHLAAQSSVPFSIKNPKRDAEINVLGTLNVLRAASEAGARKLVFFSSAAVYGDVKHLPVGEDTGLVPISPYGISKLSAEECCRIFSQKHGLQTIIFRTFNVFGKESLGVIGEFLRKINAGETITIYGTGEQTRDFLHVDDVVEACILAMKKNIAEKTVTMNLAAGKETSLNDLVVILERLTGKKIKVKHEEQRKGDIMRSYTSTKRIEEVLGFRPKYSVEEGVRKILE